MSTVLSYGDAQPTQVPDGYWLQSRVRGDDVSPHRAYGSVEPVQLIYVTGNTWQEWGESRLMVHAWPGRVGAMVSTEEKAGTRIDLGVPGVDAVYHDGMWGPHQNPDDSRAQWRSDLGHSITVRTEDRSYGVRGPRALGLEDLMAVARSLPLTR